MKEGPDIARMAALIGDPARANILTALMTGQALTASELAAEAGVSLPTASAHLAKLEAGGLLRQRKQGRHRYFALHDDEVGAVLEAMMGLAERKGHVRVRTGPRDPALRKARVCYNHLAGELAVGLYDSLCQHDVIVHTEAAAGDILEISPAGRAFFADAGIDFDQLATRRRPLCRPCLDWSARRSHLAGPLGIAIFDRVLASGWAVRVPDSRIVAFTKAGERQFRKTFRLS